MPGGRKFLLSIQIEKGTDDVILEGKRHPTKRKCLFNYFNVTFDSTQYVRILVEAYLEKKEPTMMPKARKSFLIPSNSSRLIAYYETCFMKRNRTLKVAGHPR